MNVRLRSGSRNSSPRIVLSIAASAVEHHLAGTVVHSTHVAHRAQLIRSLTSELTRRSLRSASHCAATERRVVQRFLHENRAREAASRPEQRLARRAERLRSDDSRPSSKAKRSLEHSTTTRSGVLSSRGSLREAPSGMLQRSSWCASNYTYLDRRAPTSGSFGTLTELLVHCLEYS
jgi:hypothetical protein